MQDFEWILVDDGSTDDTLGQLLALERDRAPRVRILAHASSQGAAAARNAGAAAARGRYLKFYDVDDFLEPGHFQVQTAAALQTQVDVVASPTMFLLDVDGREVRQLDRLFAEAFAEGNTLANYLTRPGFVHCGCLFRRTLFEGVGGYDETLVTDEDGWLLIQCYLQGASFAPAPATHYTYQVWYEAEGSNLSSNSSGRKLASRVEVCRRLSEIAILNDDPELGGAIAGRMATAALESGHVDYAAAEKLMARALSVSPDLTQSAYPRLMIVVRRFGFRVGLDAFQVFKALRRWRYKLASLKPTIYAATQ